MLRALFASTILGVFFCSGLARAATTTYYDLDPAHANPLPASSNGINKQDFVSLVRDVVSQYDDFIFAQYREPLRVVYQWNGNPRTHAGRDVYGLAITISGQLARELPSREALLLTVCHEVGHLAGGAPRDEAISSEGQADYFAAAKCFKRFFLKEKFSVLTQAARAQFLDLADRSAFELMKFIDSRSPEPQSPSLKDRDATIATETILSYPGLQCRLDTYLAGFRCAVDESLMFDQKDSSAGSCHFPEIGARPLCWFAR